MSAHEKAKAKAEQAEGAAVEGTGRVLGNDRMVAKGRAKKSEGDMRGAKEKTKDAFRR